DAQRTTVVHPMTLDPYPMRRLAFCALLLSVMAPALAIQSVFAQDPGPTGENVHALAIDPLTPGTLYAGTSGGVFKSTTAGASWSAINSGLATADVRSLAIDPSTPATLYAGTYSSGVFKTTN